MKRKIANTKLNPHSHSPQTVSTKAQEFSGTPLNKAKQITRFVKHHIRRNFFKTKPDKTQVFKRSADESLARRIKMPQLVCVERTNLAIALLRAAGIKAWLVRGIEIDNKKNRILIHDYAEFEANGQLFSINFYNRLGLAIGRISRGPADNSWKKMNIDFYIRGEDNYKMSRIKTWEQFNEFRHSILTNYQMELQQNEQRLQSMKNQGLIPKNILHQIPILTPEQEAQVATKLQAMQNSQRQA